MKHVTTVDHPLVQHSLTRLRDAETDIASFRLHAGTVSRILLMEATRSVPTRPLTVQTPLAPMQGAELDERIILVPVLRAGLAMLLAAQDMFDHAPVGFVGLERDEETAIARAYYERIPSIAQRDRVLILDPMLATGGSLDNTISVLRERGARGITLVCIVAAPEGIARLDEVHPDVSLYTAAVDERLDARKFIVPGLGDFGDRYFGTV